MKIKRDGDTVKVVVGGMEFTLPSDWQEDIVKAVVQREKADGWELRCGELEQELRDAQEQLDESVKCEARMGLENSKLRSQIEELQERIHELDWTIARYDDENRELKNRLIKCGEKPFPISLNEWAERIHRIAVEHGWWETEDGKCDDGDRPFPEIVALCHSELSEALEEYRNGRPFAYQVRKSPTTNKDPFREKNYDETFVSCTEQWMKGAKPEGIAVELIDCIIRILDYLAHQGVDVDKLMAAKVTYNEGREHRHGGKKA